MSDILGAHPGVIRIERELSWSSSGWEHILVIITSLPVDPTDSNHDATQLHEMTEAVNTVLREKKQGFNRLIIRNELV